MKNINKKNKIVSLVMATLMVGSVLMPLTEIKVNAESEILSSIGDPVKESTIETQKDPVYRVVTEDRPEKEFPIKDDSVEWTIDDFEISNGVVNSFSSQGYEKFNRNPENVVVKIPAKDKDGKPITTIGKNAFHFSPDRFKHRIQFVNLPYTITNIKERAFEDQDLNFEEFAVPSTWVEVSLLAFSGAYFKKLTLTGMNKESKNIIWNNITTPYVEMNGMGEWDMNKYFFDGSNIKHVNYGDSKIKLNNFSFNSVNRRDHRKNQVYKTFKITWDGQKTDADFDVPDWEMYIPYYAFRNCDALQSVTFENLPQFQSVKRNAFDYCDALQSVTFRNLPQFQSVNVNAFCDCDTLRSVIFENLPTFQSIESGAFIDSKSLTDVIFKNAYVTSIGSRAFKDTPLKNLEFIESEEKLDIPLYVNTEAFRNCNITKLELPKRYNKDDGSGFINQKFARTLTTTDFKNDPNYKLVKGEGNNNSYVTITNPISIKHGDNEEYLDLVGANPYIEMLKGPNGESNMIIKIKRNTIFGETCNATWSNNKFQIDSVAWQKGYIPFTGSVSLVLAFEELGEIHLMKDNWTHASIETIKTLRNTNFPSDKVLAAVKTAADSKVKEIDIDRKVVFASVDMTKPANIIQNSVVRVFFKDGTTTDVEVPVELTQRPSDKFVTDVELGDLDPTKEIVKQYGEYNLSDNFGTLPDGVIIVETSKKINTAFIGKYEATIDIINKGGESLRGIKVPVEVVPLDADNANIKTKEIVKEQGKGGEVDLTEGIEDYENLGIKKAETLISVKDDKVGNFNGKLKLTFEDNSTAFIYIPVKITEKQVDFNAETQKVQIYKDHVITNGDLRNAFTNLPANAEVIDLTNPPVDTSTIGEKNAKVKVILKDGRESEHVVLLEVIDPIGELEKQIEKGNEKVKTITENNEKLNKEIKNLQKQINELILKLNQVESDNLGLQNQINALTTEKERLEIVIQNNDKLIVELKGQIAIFKSQVLDLQKTIKNKDAEIAKLLEKIGKLETSMETLTNENSNLIENLSTATEKISNLEKEVERLKRDLENLNSKNKKLEDQITDAKDKNNELSNKITNLESEKNALEKELENEKSRDNSDPSKIKDLEEQIKDKEKDIQNLTNGKKSLEDEIAKLKEEREELKKIIEELNKKLQNIPSNPNNSNKPKEPDSNEEPEISDNNVIPKTTEPSSNINNISEFDFGGYNYRSSGYSGEYKETSKQKEESIKQESIKDYNPFYSLYNYLSTRDDKLEYVFTIGSTICQKIYGTNIENIQMEVKPYIKNGRTMLPLRYVAEAIGADVKWDNNTRTAIFTKDGIVAKIQIDGNEIKMSDGNIYQLDAKPDNINRRIFTPLTDVSKVFNLTNGNTKDGINQNIEWDNNTQTVTIRR